MVKPKFMPTNLPIVSTIDKEDTIPSEPKTKKPKLPKKSLAMQDIARDRKDLDPLSPCDLKDSMYIKFAVPNGLNEKELKVYLQSLQLKPYEFDFLMRMKRDRNFVDSYYKLIKEWQ